MVPHTDGLAIGFLSRSWVPAGADHDDIKPMSSRYRADIASNAVKQVFSVFSGGRVGPEIVVFDYLLAVHVPILCFDRYSVVR